MFCTRFDGCRSNIIYIYIYICIYYIFLSLLQGVDGLFITIPSDNVVAAIKECQALNVPVISVNTGAQLAVDLGLLHHISQLEYSAVRISSVAVFFFSSLRLHCARYI